MSITDSEMFPQRETVWIALISVLKLQNYKLKLKGMYSPASKIG